MKRPFSFHPKLWLAVVTVGVTALLFFVNPTEFALTPRCAFKMLTGWNCPGCGFQRAMHALLHGHWAEAWAYNRFLIYSLPYLACVLAGEFVLQGKLQDKWRRIFEGRTAILLYVALFCLWGVVRNMKGI